MHEIKIFLIYINGYVSHDSSMRQEYTYQLFLFIDKLFQVSHGSVRFTFCLILQLLGLLQLSYQNVSLLQQFEDHNKNMNQQEKQTKTHIIISDDYTHLGHFYSQDTQVCSPRKKTFPLDLVLFLQGKVI